MIEQHLYRRVSVIGLGKLGSPIAASYAAIGHHVTGVDLNPKTISLINARRPPVFEPGLEELLREGAGRLYATDEYSKAISESEITIIIVPTPSDETGAFALRYVLLACEQIGACLREKSQWHTIVVTSTVMPGATEAQVKPLIEAISGKRCGQDFGLCDSPEFVALGSVIRDLRNPDFLLIGESDERAGESTVSLIQTICQNQPPVVRMNIVNAEICKLAVNTFVTTKITFANTLARICERLPEADVDVVTGALGQDSRIGRKYLQGALGYGGPCFPRDNIAMSRLARTLSVNPTLTEAIDATNREQISFLLDRVKAELPVNGVVGILGLAYKPDTDVVEESQGLALANALLDEHISVVAYDPAAMENARSKLRGTVQFADSASQCCQQANVVVIMTAWEEFKQIRSVSLNVKHRTTIVDCWRILDPAHFTGCADYIALGIGRKQQFVDGGSEQKNTVQSKASSEGTNRELESL